MSNGTKWVILDVREELSRGEKPMGRILEAAQGLLARQGLKLITPFEPLPLMTMLRRFGLKHRARQLGEEHWETLFAKTLPDEVAVAESSEATISQAESGAASTHKIDARGLEPPQPLVKILTELEKLRGADRIEAHTDRRPLHLLDALKERGFQSTSEEQPDGSWITVIHRD